MLVSVSSHDRHSVGAVLVLKLWHSTWCYIDYWCSKLLKNKCWALKRSILAWDCSGFKMYLVAVLIEYKSSFHLNISSKAKKTNKNNQIWAHSVILIKHITLVKNIICFWGSQVWTISWFFFYGPFTSSLNEGEDHLATNANRYNRPALLTNPLISVLIIPSRQIWTFQTY